MDVSAIPFNVRDVAKNPSDPCEQQRNRNYALNKNRQLSIKD